MSEEMQTKLVQHVQEVLRIKDERDVEQEKQIDFWSKHKFHLGRQQELSRQLNEKVDDFEEYRVGGVKCQLLDSDNKPVKKGKKGKKSKKGKK